MINNTIRFLLFSVFLLLFSFVFATNDTLIDYKVPFSLKGMKLKTDEIGPKGLEVIGNFGVYLADKKHAKFYDGSDGNVNNIKYVFNNYYRRESIKEYMRVNYNRDSIISIEGSSNMHYSPSMYVGFGFRYNYSAEWALNVQFNVTKLTAKDFLSVEVFPAFDNDLRSYIRFGIVGKESRTMIDVGMVRTFNPEKNIRPMAEFGLNFSNTLVSESYIAVDEQKLSMIDIYAGRTYIPNANVQEYEIRQGGLGYGGYLGGGVKFAFNPFLSLETIAYLYMSRIPLEGYESFGIHPSAIFRIVVSPALFMEHE
ncbi:MAG: hypothetical protein PHY85_06645 [Bacteroidales bacterium]|nr:hypothetical protein [Bacteroidales bacterium]